MRDTWREGRGRVGVVRKGRSWGVARRLAKEGCGGMMVVVVVVRREKGVVVVGGERDGVCGDGIKWNERVGCLYRVGWEVMRSVWDEGSDCDERGFGLCCRWFGGWAGVF